MTARQDDITSVVFDLVEACLNKHQTETLSQLVAPGYRDHNPFSLPGMTRPARRGWGTYKDLVQLLRYLALPGVDIRFTVEDAFSSSDRVGYRLFGEGQIAALKDRDTGPQPLVAAKVANAISGGFSGTIVKKRLGIASLVELSCVGIYRFHDGRIAERWGRMSIR